MKISNNKNFINSIGKNKLINLNIKKCCHEEKYINNFYPSMVIEN